MGRAVTALHGCMPTLPQRRAPTPAYVVKACNGAVVGEELSGALLLQRIWLDLDAHLADAVPRNLSQTLAVGAAAPALASAKASPSRS
jgi:hypothetical protein